MQITKNKIQKFIILSIIISIVFLNFAFPFTIILPLSTIICVIFLYYKFFYNIKNQPKKINSNIDQIRKNKVQSLLENKQSHSDLTEIVQELGWTEQTTIITLANLVSDGSIIEELDLNGEKWIYRWNHENSINQYQKFLPIQERAQKIIQNTQQIKQPHPKR